MSFADGVFSLCFSFDCRLRASVGIVCSAAEIFVYELFQTIIFNDFDKFIGVVYVGSISEPPQLSCPRLVIFERNIVERSVAVAFEE